jgi:hypothetical protein
MNKLEAKADRIFSQYIRLRNADNDGIVRCFTCGRPLNWRGKGGNDGNAAHCGHYIKRTKRAVRFNEVNCQVQCLRCNNFLHGNDGVFRKNLVEKYGEEKILLLESQARKPFKRTAFDYEIIINEYKEKVNRELEERNLPTKAG